MDRDHGRGYRLQRVDHGRGSDAASPTAVGPVQSGGTRLRPGLRLRCRPTRARRRPSGHGRQQDGALCGRAHGGRICAFCRLQARPVGVRGRLVPTGRTVAQIQSGCTAGAHGRPAGDGRRTVGHRAENLRGRTGGARISAGRGPGGAGGAGPVALLQLSADRP